MLNTDDRIELFRRLRKIGGAEPEAVEMAKQFGKSPSKKKRCNPQAKKNNGSTIHRVDFPCGREQFSRSKSTET